MEHIWVQGKRGRARTIRIYLVRGTLRRTVRIYLVRRTLRRTVRIYLVKRGALGALLEYFW